jgi:1-acyl-sn-glycerol-3-phosphate acyltransferase
VNAFSTACKLRARAEKRPFGFPEGQRSDQLNSNQEEEKGMKKFMPLL